MPLHVKSTFQSEFFYLSQLPEQSRNQKSSNSVPSLTAPLIKVPFCPESLCCSFFPFIPPYFFSLLGSSVQLLFKANRLLFHTKENVPRICCEFRFILSSYVEKNFRKPCSAIRLMPVNVCSSPLNVLLFLICSFSALSLKRFHQLLSNNTN